jgi:pyruvate ferredoxin oxidoreductase delta subunit
MASGRIRRPSYHSHRCKGCELCRWLCPDLAITRDAEGKRIQIDLKYCKGCGICAAFCPKGALEMVRESETEHGGSR